jgi:V/A-type H+-transporting ATPase subunit K
MTVDIETMASLGKLGATMSLFFGAVGSCLGVGTAGLTAVGSWKKCFAQNKAAPFVLVTFVGAPLSQTIYGMILMNQIAAKCVTTGEGAAAAVANWPAMIGIGALGGIALGLSAWIQGRIGAAAADAMAETGKGFGNYLMALGIIETVALFAMVFLGQIL